MTSSPGATLPAGYATDDGVGLVYRGSKFVETVTEIKGKAVYHVERTGDTTVETRIEPTTLPGAA